MSLHRGGTVAFKKKRQKRSVFILKKATVLGIHASGVGASTGCCCFLDCMGCDQCHKKKKKKKHWGGMMVTKHGSQQRSNQYDAGNLNTVIFFILNVCVCVFFFFLPFLNVTI